MSISNGLISTFSPITSLGKWIGYQIFLGVGRGIGMQMVRSSQSTTTKLTFNPPYLSQSSQFKTHSLLPKSACPWHSSCLPKTSPAPYSLVSLILSSPIASRPLFPTMRLLSMFNRSLMLELLDSDPYLMDRSWLRCWWPMQRVSIACSICLLVHRFVVLYLCG